VYSASSNSIALKPVFYPSVKYLKVKIGKVGIYREYFTLYLVLYSIFAPLLKKGKMILKIRVILDTEENVIRDIAIDGSDNLEDLHNAITNAFGFSGTEMSSFYISDEEWNQGEEFPLFDMSEVPGEVTQMREISIKDVLDKKGDKLIYIYDFIFMWTFYVELIEISDEETTDLLPQLIFSLGEVPKDVPEKKFESDDSLSDEFDLDDDDEYDYDPDEFWS